MTSSLISSQVGAKLGLAAGAFGGRGRAASEDQVELLA